MTDRVIRGANWWCEDINQTQRTESATLPRLNKAVENFVAGGGWQALEIGLEIEPLTAVFVVKGVHADLRKRFGFEAGNWTTVHYYERLRDLMNGKNLGRLVTLKGLLREVQQPRVNGMRAEMTTLQFGSIVLYRDVEGDRKVHEFDFFNNTLIMDNVDYSAESNRLLAIQGGIPRQ